MPDDEPEPTRPLDFPGVPEDLLLAALQHAARVTPLCTSCPLLCDHYLEKVRGAIFRFLRQTEHEQFLAAHKQASINLTKERTFSSKQGLWEAYNKIKRGEHSPEAEGFVKDHPTTPLNKSDDQWRRFNQGKPKRPPVKPRPLTIKEILDGEKS